MPGHEEEKMIVVNQDKTEFLECDSIKLEVTDGKYSIQARKTTVSLLSVFSSQKKKRRRH